MLRIHPFIRVLILAVAAFLLLGNTWPLPSLTERVPITAAFLVLLISGMFLPLLLFRYYQATKFFAPWIIFSLSFLVSKAEWSFSRFLLLYFRPDIVLNAVSETSLPFLLYLFNSISGIVFWYEMRMRSDEETQSRYRAMEQLAKETELNKLTLQLQPHFLFNSLNSVNALLGKDAMKARHMIHILSAFLRKSLQSDRSAWHTIQNELELIQHYLEIEQIRFEGRLFSSIELDEKAANDLIPGMILQPFIENAIKYGMYEQVGECHIHIQIVRLDSYVHIRISNPVDSSSFKTQGNGFGLEATRRRLQLLFNRNDLLEINHESGQFQVLLKFPKHD